ncbi:MAG: hypothetical protein L0Z62_29130 [Gemmataceae bacterium]|nr:hypothetical protein [Gemmataceae bacterium]
MPSHRVRKPKLTVATSGTTHYIEVPSQTSAALRAYLCGHGVRALPAEPCASHLDTIELGRGTDLSAVQGLLDRWA